MHLQQGKPDQGLVEDGIVVVVVVVGQGDRVVVEVQLSSEEPHWVGRYNANVDNIFAEELLTNLGWGE